MVSALTDFLEGLDRQRQEPAPDLTPQDTLTGEGRRRASEIMDAIYRRQADRAGVDVDELNELGQARTVAVVEVLIMRISGGNTQVARAAASSFGHELHRAISELWLDGFLSGALWEQQRQMPDLEP